MDRRRAAVVLGAMLAMAGCDRIHSASPPKTGGAGPPPVAPAVAPTAAPPVVPLLEIRRIGRLRLPSGRVVACDPFACERARPFARSVPPGEFPLELAIADPGPEARVAFARILFSPGPVVAWEPALVAGEDPARLRGGGLFGYGVDSGTGAFMDAGAWQAYRARMTREPQRFPEFLFERFERNASASLGWLLLPLGPGSVALFSSGEGDGGYASYWGLDAGGRLAALVTDFDVVPGAATVPGATAGD